MKKLGIVFCLLLSLCLCTACGDATSPAVTEPPSESIDLSGYTVIVEDGVGTEVSEAVVRLMEEIQTVTGLSLRIESDWVMPDDPIPTDTQEILVGKTNRPESDILPADAKSMDYAIAYDGRRIAVVGETEAATAAGLEALTARFHADGIRLPRSTQVQRGVYAVEDIRIAGKSLSEFAIVYPAADVTAKAVAGEVRALLSEQVGYRLSMYSDTGKGQMPALAVRISPTEGGRDCTVLVEGTELQLGYQNAGSAVQLLDVLRTMIGEAEGGVLTLDAGFSLTEEAEECRIVLLGDSNTALTYIQTWIETYLTTRYPERIFRVYNAGVSGGAADGAYERLQWDVLDYDPDIVIVNFGCNVVLEKIGSLTGEVNASAYKNAVTWFRTNMKRVVSKLVDAGVEVILTTPLGYDEWVESDTANYRNAYLGFEEMAQDMKELAAEYGLECADYYDNMMTLMEEYRAETGTTEVLLVGTDRKHLNRKGALAVAFAYAEETRFASEGVASVVIAADGNTVQVDGADVTLHQGSKTGVSFSYTPRALPLPKNQYYTELQNYGYLELAQRNAERLTVTGLAAGEYELAFDGKVLGTFSSDALAEGIELTDLEKNPSLAKAAEIYKLYEEKNKMVSAGRGMVYGWVNYVLPNGFQKLSETELRTKVDAYLKAEAGSTKYLYGIMSSYFETYDQLPKYRARIEELLFQIAMLTEPVTYQVTVTAK